MTAPGLANVAVALAREHLAAGRPLRTRTAGHSMWPLYRDGEAVEVLPLGDAPLAVGDVVLSARSGRLVLHRIVALAEERVWTKGDAIGRRDEAISRCDILGRLRRRPWDRCLAGVSQLGVPALARALALARRLGG